MKYADYFETEGACCWDLYKRKKFNARGDKTNHHGATEKLMKPAHEIKSVKRVDC